MSISETWRGQIYTVTNLPFPRPGSPVEIEVRGQSASIHLNDREGDRPSGGNKSLRGRLDSEGRLPQPTIQGEYLGLGRFELTEIDSRTPRGRKFQCVVYGPPSRGEGEVEIGCWVADDDGDGKRHRDGGGNASLPR